MSSELEQSLASITIGTLMLYGATCIQTLFSLELHSHDLTWIKVANYGNVLAFLVMTWYYSTVDGLGQLFIPPIVAFIVQTVYARRIYALISQKRRILRIVLAMTTMSLSAAAVVIIRTSNIALFTGVENEPLFSISTGLSFASDMFIAGTLIAPRVGGDSSIYSDKNWAQAVIGLAHYLIIGNCDPKPTG
ncbi:hypothetical protein BDQ17DRAFT_1337220 [Cyathus striatus]|nr:hypothetical protein BDQ17DRAFT_1337220 [Cyathus striatus]